MKKTILAICLVGSLACLAGCEKYDDLFPEYCHKVLNIKDGGERDVTLKAGNDTEYKFSVMKSGSEASASVSGFVSSMNEAEYKSYSGKYNISQEYLTSEYYTLVDNNLSFSGQDRYKFVKVVFKTDAINTLQKTSGKKYALPLKLVSNDATVNDSIIILKPDIEVSTAAQ